ncbi:MAG: Mth938-like domain-containing protein [Rubrivivax sp.]
MKLQPDRADGVNAITRHDSAGIRVGQIDFLHSVLVPWQGDVAAWPPRNTDELNAGHFEQILAWQPELVIFGSGRRLRFVAPALMRSLIERRIGVETMDTAAACRTYNVLAGEGRTVVAALIIEPDT